MTEWLTTREVADAMGRSASTARIDLTRAATARRWRLSTARTWTVRGGTGSWAWHPELTGRVIAAARDRLPPGTGRTTQCATCQADPDTPCRTRGGTRRRPHPGRT